jgi:hypothetical protein
MNERKTCSWEEREVVLEQPQVCRGCGRRIAAGEPATRIEATLLFGFGRWTFRARPEYRHPGCQEPRFESNYIPRPDQRGRRENKRRRRGT